MKKIITLAVAAIAAACILSGCNREVTIKLHPYNYAVNEQFSLFTGLEIQNDFDGTISMLDNAKWTFVISDNVSGNMEKVGTNFVKVTSACSGTVYAIYDKGGRNLTSNEVPIVIK